MDISSFDSSDDDGLGGRSGVFTPARLGRQSLIHDFSPTPSRSATSEEITTTAQKQKQKNRVFSPFPRKNNTRSNTSFSAEDGSNTLPKLHNSSWLGADMSPIRKETENNKTKNDQDAAVAASFGLGLTERSNSSTPSESLFLGANEDTNELSKGQAPKVDMQSTATTNNNQNPSAFQKVKFYPRKMPFARTTLPFFGHARPNADSQNTDDPQQRPRRRKLLNPTQPKFWNFWAALVTSPREIDPTYNTMYASSRAKRKSSHFVLGVTAFVLFCIGIHDTFSGYLSMRRGEASSYSLTWSFPWFGPSSQSLLLFGAFSPELILKASFFDYWRVFSSMLIPISVFEWLLLMWVWTRYLPSSLFVQPRNTSLHLSWPLIYVLSAWTGQLWMTAFHYETLRMYLGQQQQNGNGYDDLSLPALSGCAGWATAGVLCAVGIQAPNRRFPCFLSVIGLVLLHQFQSTGSVIGCAAAAFFGWAYSGIWSQNFPEEYSKQWQREMLHREYTYQFDVLQERRNFVNETPHRWTVWHVLAAMIVFLLWFAPIIFLLYR